MSRSHHFTASLELPAHRSSSNSPIVRRLSKNSSSPVEQSSHALTPPEVTPSSFAAGDAKYLGRRSSSSDSFELRAELARMQEREAALAHILCLEKEHRVKAERIVEVERMACLELKHRLRLQEKGCDPRKAQEEGISANSSNEDINVSPEVCMWL